MDSLLTGVHVSARRGGDGRSCVWSTTSDDVCRTSSSTRSDAGTPTELRTPAATMTSSMTSSPPTLPRVAVGRRKPRTSCRDTTLAVIQPLPAATLFRVVLPTPHSLGCMFHVGVHQLLYSDSIPVLLDPLVVDYTQGEVTSHNLCSRCDRHFVGITQHSLWSYGAKI